MVREFKGLAVAPGIAIAPIIHYRSGLDFIPTRTIKAADAAGEQRRFGDAVERAVATVLRLRDEIAARLSVSDAAIYDAQVAILRDPGLRKEVDESIAKDLVNAEVALQRVIARYEQVFESIPEASLRERAADVRDVGRQILLAMSAADRKAMMAESDYLFAVDEFLPSDAGVVDRSHLRGIVSTTGGKYSHGAILARSFGIPCVVGVEDVLHKIKNGTLAVLDGEKGVLVVEPEAEVLQRYRERMDEIKAVEHRLLEVRQVACRTPDGESVELYANDEGKRDLNEVIEHGLVCVGLFRTKLVLI
jgi:phosphotransferase system enzyme I (PtsI)